MGLIGLIVENYPKGSYVVKNIFIERKALRSDNWRARNVTKLCTDNQTMIILSIIFAEMN